LKFGSIRGALHFQSLCNKALVNYQLILTPKCMKVLPEISNERQHFNPLRFVGGFLFKLGYFI
ncbi:hypothetical protein, partial [Acinetobacter johnsonii]